MNLPKPRSELAGCMWLPRILAKARLFLRGELPREYVVPFCHTAGVDGQFLAHFGLTKDDVLAAAALPDSAVEAWWLARPGVTRASVAAWNELAVNLGRPGFPMSARLPIALQTIYKNVADRNLSTVFEVLEADEADTSAN
jgi:hypothetical protein